MKSHARWPSSLALATLLGIAGPVSAQPYGYGPPPIPPGYGPGPMHHGMERMPAMPSVPEMPMRPGAPTTQPSAPHQAPAAPGPERFGATPRMPQGPVAEASATLKEGMDKLLAYLAQKEVPNKLQVAAFLDREIAPYFDFDYMAQWVAGPTFQSMSEKDKQALAAHLESEFLGTLASHLMQYDGQQIRMLPPRMGPRGAVSVNVAVMRPGTPPTKLEFRMYESDTGWRVYDVSADGQSAAAYYRVQFQRMAAGPGTAGGMPTPR